MNAAMLSVDPELLRKSLGLPDGTRITGVTPNYHTAHGMSIELRVEHPDLPPTPLGEMLRYAHPRYDTNGFASWE